MENLPGLTELLADCEEIYRSGGEEVINEVALFMASVKRLVRFKNKQINDACFWDPQTLDHNPH